MAREVELMPSLKTAMGWLFAVALTGAAFAQSDPQDAAEGDAATEQDETAPRVREPLPSKTLQDIADRLNARERALDRRERDLTDRETDLRDAEQRISQRLEELRELREALQNQVGEADDLTEERLVGLVKMFEAMRSKDGAAVMTEMSQDHGVKVLDRMNRMKAGKLLAAMEPTVAAGLASRMATPIQLAPGAGGTP